MNSKIPVFSPGAPVEWIGVVREGNQIMAVVGPDLVAGLGGFGDTIPEALRDLADQMERNTGVHQKCARGAIPGMPEYQGMLGDWSWGFLERCS